MNSFSYLEPVCCSMFSSNYCFLTYIQISQEAGQVVWYSHLFQNFPQFTVIHTVNGLRINLKLAIWHIVPTYLEKAMAPHSSTLAWKIRWTEEEGCSPWDRWGSDTIERLHFHFHFHASEKEMATHSSVLAWRIPGMGEPGGLPSMGLHRVGHDWNDLAGVAAATNLPTTIFKISTRNWLQTYDSS